MVYTLIKSNIDILDTTSILDMKRIFSIFAIVAATLSLVSCNKDKHGNDLGITFHATCDMAPVFSADGGEREYSFTTKCDWTIEAADEWITVTTDSGSGSGSFSLQVASHETGEQRESYIIMHLSNGKAVKIPVVQLMRERFDVADTEIYTISENGGPIEIPVSTNWEYKVSVPKGVEWLAYNIDTRAMRDETICFNVEPNSANLSRTATIYVRANDYDSTLLHTFTIIQAANGKALNEITYTTSSNAAIELDVIEDFGARFVTQYWEGDYGRIIFASEVTTIPYYAFSNQSDITSIDLPANIKAIEDEAFSGCTGIEVFTIPAKVEHIGAKAFDGCHGEIVLLGKLANQSVATTDDSHWLNGSEFSDVVCHNNIGSNSFAEYEPLQRLTFMEGVTAVSSNAFEGCSALECVTAPSLEQWCSINFDNAAANPIANDSVDLMIDGATVMALNSADIDITAINRYTFAYYDNLESITLDDEVQSIGWGAFEGCSVDYISLGNGIVSMGSNAFNKATTESLTINFDMPDMQKDATKSSHWLYGLTATDVIFGNQVKSIGNLAISQLMGVEDVVVSDSVEYIGEGAFANCAMLAEVDLGAGVKTLDQHAFFNCTALAEITLPEGITTIEGYAFDSCTAITNFTIPASVTTIGEYAFNNCNALTEVKCLPVTPPTLGNIYVFEPAAKIHVPASAYDAYIKAENWKRLTDRIVGDL